jgi:hypothetical protein
VILPRNLVHRLFRTFRSGRGTALASNRTNKETIMKIRTFIRLLGLGAIGGVAYVHTQRRGEWTVASLKDTLRHLQQSMGNMFSGQGERGRDTLERAANVTEGGTRNSISDSARSYPDYANRKNDPGHH